MFRIPAILLAVTMLAAPVQAELVVRAEDFTSRAWADTVLTTAAWDTVSGTLHLHTQGLLQTGTLAVGGQARAVAWRDGHVLVATGSAKTLAVVDVADPALPGLVKQHTLPTEARHVLVRGDKAYVALGSGLGVQVVDVATVTSPVSGARVDLTGYTAQTVAAGNWLYAAISAGGVGVLDLSDPATPVAGPAVDAGGWVRGVDAGAAHLYVAVDDRLAVLSLASPASPASVGTVTLSGTGQTVAAAEPLVYVGSSVGVDVIDVSDPASPQILQTIPLATGTAFGATVQGDSLYVANGNGGLHIIDITVPGAASVVGLRQSPEYYYNVLARDGLLYAGNGDAGLQILAADPLGLDPVRNMAYSRNLNPTGEPISRVRLTSNRSDSLAFAISGDGGTTWTPLADDGAWLDLDPDGDDLRWRATLVQTGPYPGPVCENLTVEFERLHSYAELSSVADVPGDDGGRVRLVWDASRFDAPGSSPLVTSYSVYRRYDPAVAHAKAYPPGSWEYLLSVPADQEATYAVSVATAADSSAAGTNWAVFFVRARTATPGEFFDSPPDSGYSVDNLAPAPVTGFGVLRDATGVHLSWDPSSDPDFAHFRVYRADSPLTPPGPATLLAVTGGTTHFDAAPGTWFYYLVTQVDVAGRESPASPAASAAPAAVPEVLRVGRPFPNPFNPAVRIAYTVPASGALVRVEILDARGRLVAVLQDGHQPGGEHDIVWRGRDSRGRAAASGRYTCRIRSGTTVLNRGLTLVR